MAPWFFLLVWAVMVASLRTFGFHIVGEAAHPKWRGSFDIDLFGAGGQIKSSVLALFAAMPLVLLLAVRKDVGTDYQAYVEMFGRIQSGMKLAWVEPFYLFINRIMVSFGSAGIVGVFAIAAALSAFPLFYRVLHSSPVPWLGMIILFGLGLPFFMVNVVRGSIAVSLVMLVLPAVWKRQFVIWSLGVFFAAGFHFTALLVWPLYWILHLAWSRILLLIGLAVAIGVSSSRGLAVGILNWAPTIIPVKYSHYPDLVLKRLGAYEFGLGYLIYFILLFLLFIVWGRIREAEREVLVFRNTAALGVVLAIALYQFWAVNRLALYFLPALAVFLPWIVVHCVERKEKVLWTAGLAAFFGMMYVRGLWVGAHDAIPYQWIFKAI